MSATFTCSFLDCAIKSARSIMVGDSVIKCCLSCMVTVALRFKSIMSSASASASVKSVMTGDNAINC